MKRGEKNIIKTGGEETDGRKMRERDESTHRRGDHHQNLTLMTLSLWYFVVVFLLKKFTGFTWHVCMSEEGEMVVAGDDDESQPLSTFFRHHHLSCSHTADDETSMTAVFTHYVV